MARRLIILLTFCLCDPLSANKWETSKSDKQVSATREFAYESETLPLFFRRSYSVKTDCPDGSDEKKCINVGCKGNEFSCKNRVCTSIDFKCDGFNDCGDNSDELDCRTATTKLTSTTKAHSRDNPVSSTIRVIESTSTDSIHYNSTIMNATKDSSEYYFTKTANNAKIAFDFGFEVFQPNQSSVTNKVLCHPVKGTENMFLMKLTNDKSKVKSVSLGEIISLEGKVLASFSLKAVLGADDLFFGEFLPANTDYHLRINGETKSGQRFQSNTSVAFSSISSNTETSSICVIKNMDFIPEEILNWSSIFSKKSWSNCLFVKVAFVWRLLFIPADQYLAKLFFFSNCF